jgi:hypothetical protein
VSVAFRQEIRRGNVGLDVLATKRALQAVGFGGIALTQKAGSVWEHDVARMQRAHNLQADGVYGKATHAVLVRHFDGYSTWLYRHAKLRPRRPAVPNSAQAAAKLLLEHHRHGRYRADNPGDLRDVEATAAGHAVFSQGGYWVHVDARVMQALCLLVAHFGEIGTYAICSDHHNDGPHGHAGGHAFDVSTIAGVSVAERSARSRRNVLALDRTLRAAGRLRPRQLISGGYGRRRDAACSLLSLPGADWYYGSRTMAGHCDHVHGGY